MPDFKTLARLHTIFNNIDNITKNNFAIFYTTVNLTLPALPVRYMKGMRIAFWVIHISRYLADLPLSQLGL